MRLSSGILLSHGEENANRILREFFNEMPYLVYKEVSVRQVIEAEREELTPGEWSFYIQSSFDFLICGAVGRQPPELAVEFDSGFHDNPDQQRKDRLKNRLCQEAGLPLLRVRSDHVLKREGESFLKYILTLHFGERAVQERVSAGRLSWDAEYFPSTQFPGTDEIQKRLVARGVFPPIVPLSIPATEAEDRFWFRVSTGQRSVPEPFRRNQASAKVEILRGWNTPQVVLSVERTASLTECSPGHDVLGVHGWFLAQELALFLAFQEAERLLPQAPPNPGTV